MRLLAALAVLAGLAQAQQPAVSLSVRDNPRGSRSLLLAVDQAGVDEITLRVGGDAAKSARLGHSPPGWAPARKGAVVTLSGPKTSANAHFRVDIEAETSSKVRVELLAGRKKVFSGEIEPAERPAAEVRNDSAALNLPATIVPGETIALSPGEGTWSINDIEIGESWTAPAEATSLRVVQRDAWGEVAVDARHDAKFEADPLEAQGPRLTACMDEAQIGSIFAVCGHFPGNSARALLLDGRPIEELVSASLRVATVRLAKDLEPGVHVLSGDPGAGYSASDQLLFDALAVSGALAKQSLSGAESTDLIFTVRGSRAPKKLKLRNLDSSLVALPGGVTELTLTSSGGAENVARTTLRKVRLTPGRQLDFRLTFELLVEPSPCAGEQLVERNDQGLWPARALAAIPVAAQAAMDAAAQAIGAALGLNVVETAALPSTGLGLVVFAIPDARAVPVVTAALAADPRVLFAQPDFVYETHGQAAPATDPYARLFWGRALIGADRMASQGEGVQVAVVDTGIDVENEELDGLLLEQTDFTGYGWSSDIHGTQIAGIIAARPDNGVGIAGVAPGARLLGMKACQPTSRQAIRAQCWSSAIAKGVDHAAGSAARVINLSVGGRKEDEILRRQVEAAAEQGKLVVAAAGNDGPGAEPSFPAALEAALAVTAVDARKGLYGQATRGTFVDLAAPGVEILSPAPGGRFPLCSGTSFSTAFVSGAAALLAGQSPHSDGRRIRAALETSSEDLGAPGKDSEFGSGLVDVCRAAAELGDGERCRAPR